MLEFCGKDNLAKAVVKDMADDILSIGASKVDGQPEFSRELWLALSKYEYGYRDALLVSQDMGIDVKAKVCPLAATLADKYLADDDGSGPWEKYQGKEP